MADKILGKDQLASFLSKLKEGASVYAPSREADRLVWSPAGEADDLLWDYGNTTMSPKDFFFPQTECLMHFDNDPRSEQGMIMQAEPELDGERVLWGIRPCDAKAFGVLDLIFHQDDYTDDPYWRDKREKTTLISLACNNPCPTCFCSSMNCGPHHEEGSDLLLVDLGDKLLVKVRSAKGEALTGDLTDAAEGDLSQAADLKKAAEETLASGTTVGMDQVTAKPLMELFDDDMWDQVQESCYNCGACTFCCPTCHCFDIQDETQGDYGRRVRNWDYCMSWLFTVHGTGHNPRPGKKERVRQRFMHKFKYIPMKRDGQIGCVGCGRCVLLCPVNIDVREVVNRMNG